MAFSTIKPIKPAPIMTTRGVVNCVAACSTLAVWASVQRCCTPGRSVPGIGRSRGVEPVASSSLSKAKVSPAAKCQRALLRRPAGGRVDADLGGDLQPSKIVRHRPCASGPRGFAPPASKAGPCANAPVRRRLSVISAVGAEATNGLDGVGRGGAAADDHELFGHDEGCPWKGAVSGGDASRQCDAYKEASPNSASFSWLWRAVVIPAACPVVVRQHGIQMDGDAGRGARLVRFLQQSRRQRIIGLGQTGSEVPQAFQIPRPLAGSEEVVERELDTGRGGGAGDE